MESIRSILTHDELKIGDYVDDTDGVGRCRVVGIESDSVVLENSQQRVHRFLNSTFDFMHFKVEK